MLTALVRNEGRVGFGRRLFTMEEKMAKFAAYEVKAGGEGVWVNLDLVTKIVPAETRATLHFVDGSALSVDCPANQVADHANDR